MASAPLGTTLRHIRQLAGSPTAQGTTDLQLLHRFTDERDDDAFSELLRRHGPLVLSVCRRVLGHQHDAEDAFQAAFLVLARQATSIRKGESVGSFLYGVAYRIAMKERSRLFQRRHRERQAQPPAPSGPVYEAAWRELQGLLDEGLHRLPEKYRTPFVLCCLQGKSKSEAARELGWKEGTVSSRLAQARKQLQEWLSRKGVTLSAALAAVGIAETASSAGVPPVLMASSVRLAELFMSGWSAEVLETARAVQLAEAALRSMAALSWKTAATLLMVVCLAAGGTSLTHHAETAQQAPANEPPKATPSAARKPARQEEKVRTDRYGDPLPSGALARLGTTRFRQGYLVRQVAFSPDGKVVACAGAGRGVCLWDAATGKELRQIDRKTHAESVAFSPDGKVLACAFYPRPLQEPVALYEEATGRKIVDLPCTAGIRAHTLAYAPDGKTIAGVILSGSAIHFFDAATGEKRKREVPSGQDEIHQLAWSPDSKKLAWLGQNGFIHLWDVDKGEEIGRWKGHDTDVHRVWDSMAFAPDGKTLATGSSDQTIRLWDVATHKEKHVLDGKHQRVGAVVFSRDGRALASGHHDGTIALWDVAKGEEIRRWQAHSYTVNSLDFSPDGKTLVSGAAWECGPRLWDVATGTEVRPFAGHTTPIDRLWFSPDGKRIRSQGWGKKVLDWDLASGRERLHFQLPLHGAISGWDFYALAPRGEVAVSWGFYDDTIRLWDVATGKERRALGKFHNSEKDHSFFAPLDFSSDGRLLAFGTKDGLVPVVSVWDAVAGAERQQLKGLARPVLGVTFSPDGKKIAAGSAPALGYATIKLWDVKTGESLAEFASRERVDRLAFSPDGKILASASYLGTARPRLWDAATGRELRSLELGSLIGASPDGKPLLYGLAFSPDGKWLAGAGADDDQKIHVWEIETGLEVRRFQGHITSAFSVAFAPDGRTLASGGGDSSVLLWDFTGRMKEGRLQAVKWTPRELEKRWIDLASSAGPQAVQALWDLVASPEQAVPLLRQRINPEAAADARHVERLIRDLDSEDFETRAKAMEKLGKIVDGAEPILRKKLAEKPPLEVRQRIKQVLGKLEPLASAERLRALRAVQVLEYTGTSEAKEVLRTLTKGMPQAQLTRQAKAALERLAK